MSFTPKIHNDANATWAKALKNGYSVSVFLGTTQASLRSATAEDILRKAWDLFVSFDDQSESFATIAKVRTPSGETATLRLDRDYFEVVREDSEGKGTVASWQFYGGFRGLAQGELWLNMAELAERK